MTLKVEGHRVRITHFIYLIGIFVVVLCERHTQKASPARTWASSPIRSVVLHDKKGSEANSGRSENGLQTNLASGTLSGGEEIK